MTEPRRIRDPSTVTVPVEALRAVDRLDDLGASGTDQAREAHDLACVDLEVDAGEDTGEPEVLHVEDHLAAGVVALGPARKDVLDRPARHQRDQLGGRRVRDRQAGGHGATVLEHRDPVADLADLLEPVGDVDDRNALGGEAADHPEQVGDALLVQHRGRLVEHQQPRVPGEGPGHADDLLLGRRQLADDPRGRDLGVSEPSEQVAHQRAGLASLGEPGAGHLVAEEDVLGDVEVWDQVELLVDGRDAVLDGLRRRRERGLLAVPGDGAGVGLVEPGEHLDQGGLAGAVLAEQAVHLTRSYVEVDAVQGPHAGELLDDAGHPEQRLVAGSHPAPPPFDQPTLV